MLFFLGLELGLALLLLPRPVQGQQAEAGGPISLREAVARAVQHNPALAQTGAELAQVARRWRSLRRGSARSCATATSASSSRAST